MTRAQAERETLLLAANRRGWLGALADVVYALRRAPQLPDDCAAPGDIDELGIANL